MAFLQGSTHWTGHVDERSSRFIVQESGCEDPRNQFDKISAHVLPTV